MIDPCFADNQNFASSFAISQDRGENQQSTKQYSKLANNIIVQVNGKVKHQTGIPCLHRNIKCQK
jgi:hypothetical protein